MICRGKASLIALIQKKILYGKTLSNTFQKEKNRNKMTKKKKIDIGKEGPCLEKVYKSSYVDDEGSSQPADVQKTWL